MEIKRAWELERGAIIEAFEGKMWKKINNDGRIVVLEAYGWDNEEDGIFGIMCSDEMYLCDGVWKRVEE